VISSANSGRLVFLGHLSILTLCRGVDPELSMILEALCRYAASKHRDVCKALILACPQAAADSLRTSLTELEMTPVVATEVRGTGQYQFIITTTSYNNVSALESYLASGGGVIMCAMGARAPIHGEMRSLLQRYGIGIPEYRGRIGDFATDSHLEIRISSKDKFSLPKLIAKFVKLAESPQKLMPEQIKKLVTGLRLHIAALTDDVCPQLQELATACWYILDTDAAANELSVCPLILHSLIAVLLADILPKLPARCFEDCDRSVPFPGFCSVEISEYTLRVSPLLPTTWSSTGLYLPPGVLATARTDRGIPGAWIQVGAHTCTAISRPGPWKRFPGVTVRFPLDHPDVEICSPFGGILYIGCTEPQYTAFDIELRNVGRHPVCTAGDQSLSGETQTMLAPWGEIVTEFVIFTVPRTLFSSLFQVFISCTRLDHMVSEVLAFLADNRTSPYRVVFDVEMTASSHEIDYPFFLPIEFAENIFQNGEPSVALFQFLQGIAFRSLPRFRRTAREALAALAVWDAVSAWRPENADEIRDMIHTSSRLFPVLKKIHEEIGAAEFTPTLKRIRAAAGKAYDLDAMLMNALSMLCRRDLSAEFCEAEAPAPSGASDGLFEYRLEKSGVTPMG
jgi:hypothetical protein